MEKYYGVFKFCFDSSRWDSASNKNWEIYYNFIMKNGGNGQLRGESNGMYRGTNYATEDKKQAQNWCSDQRWMQREEDSHRRCGYDSYKHQFCVHECDAKGYWVPSKAELKKAMEWRLTSNRQNWDNSPATVLEEIKDDYVSLADGIIAKIGDAE